MSILDQILNGSSKEEIHSIIDSVLTDKAVDAIANYELSEDIIAEYESLSESEKLEVAAKLGL